MEIAIVSDIHDNLKNLTTLLDICEAREIQHLICCGDLCSPFVIGALGESNLNCYIVFGNNDGDKFNMLRLAEQYKNLKLFGKTELKLMSVNQKSIITILNSKMCSIIWIGVFRILVFQ